MPGTRKFSGAPVGTLGWGHRQRLPKQGGNSGAALVSEVQNQEMELVQSCSAPSPISIQNYEALSTTSTKLALVCL